MHTTLRGSFRTFAQFEKAADIITQNVNGKTFLHCKKGKHRSVFVAAITQIKAGRITTNGDLNIFLAENGFFTTKEKTFCQKYSINKEKTVILKN